MLLEILSLRSWHLGARTKYLQNQISISLLLKGGHHKDSEQIPVLPEFGICFSSFKQLGRVVVYRQLKQIMEVRIPQ